MATDDAVAGGIGIGGIVIGVALLSAAAGIKGQLDASVPTDDKGQPLCGATSGAATDPVCVNRRSQARLGSDLNDAGIGFLVAGGLLTGAALAYWLVPAATAKPGPRTAAPLRVLPAVTGTGGGLVVVGSF